MGTRDSEDFATMCALVAHSSELKMQLATEKEARRRAEERAANAEQREIGFWTELQALKAQHRFNVRLGFNSYEDIGKEKEGWSPWGALFGSVTMIVFGWMVVNFMQFLLFSKAVGVPI